MVNAVEAQIRDLGYERIDDLRVTDPVCGPKNGLLASQQPPR